ncbi:MAG: helix-turn-helix transcriptional regulator [Lachnospiraceae bacterium]|nr:helix-turn-helix transcriptional regulator [Lachnospiraceae bacterium]
MFKDNLTMLRRANNLSQEDVAEKVNVSRQAYAKWERGESVPDIEKCAALAALYNTTLDDLYREEKLPGGMDVMPAPKGKHLFGTVTVNDKGQIVIPKKAREVMQIGPGDDLVVLADEQSGLALVKAEWFEKHLMDMMETIRNREQ